MRNVLALLVILVVAAVVVAAQAVPAITGVWKPDTSKGSMRMVPLDRRLTVTMPGNEIVFEEGPLTEPSKAKTMRYRVGVESENGYLGRPEKATATWENGRLVIKGVREMGVQGTPTPFTLTVSVSPDGNELQIEERTDTGSTVFTALRVFTREK